MLFYDAVVLITIRDYARAPVFPEQTLGPYMWTTLPTLEDIGDKDDVMNC